MNGLMRTIEDMMPHFSKGQKKIAAYIFENYDKAAFMTASKLGREVGVSESTVVRFAAVVGFEGYPQFQRSLKELIKRNLNAVQRVRVTDEQIGEGDVLSKVLNMDIDTVKKTDQAIDIKDFNEAVDRILDAKRIYVMGMRGAYSLSSFINYYFNMLFDNVTLVRGDSNADVFEQIIRIGEGDVILGISFPRYSKKTVRALQYAKDQGACVISITDSPKSPIAALSDVVLYAKSEMISFVDSLVAPMSLINALLVTLGQRRHEQLYNTLLNLETIWDEYQVYENIGEVYDEK
ncbi:MAG: MurR/RpiR family transcriptional regulator [Oscillospiraceae bacterium]|nr:MurR/RpiR family transcriptional regulator [Oscillospiraceae bacterium]